MDVVILLHAVGGQGGQWQRFIRQAEQLIPQAVHWHTPTAPVIPQTWLGGKQFTAWYDFEEIFEDKRQLFVPVTCQYLEAAAVVLQKIGELVAAGTPPERIVLGGFSQGGSVAFAALLLLEWRLGGVFVYGAAVQSVETLRAYFQTRVPVCQATPVLVLQGDRDYTNGKDQTDITRDFLLRELGFHHYHFRVFPDTGHEVTLAMRAEAIDFIRQCLP